MYGKNFKISGPKREYSINKDSYNTLLPDITYTFTLRNWYTLRNSLQCIKYLNSVKQNLDLYKVLQYYIW